MRSSFTSVLPGYLLAAVSLALTCAGVAARAQSTDVGLPTPVYTNELAGRIPPRDVGDARLTRHFYTFNASEGDLQLTVESTDLNGDVDLFTANTLRPLLKITLYAVGSAPTRAVKSVYLRRDETLILRVEGRTVIDGDALYRIRLGGAFRPAAGTPPQLAETETPAESKETGARGRRTTATGARIPETPAEREAREAREAAAAEAAAVEEARRVAAEEARRVAEEERRAEAARTAPAAEPTTRRATGRRNPRTTTTRPGSRRTRPPETAAPTERTEEERAADADKSSDATVAEPPATRTSRTRSSRRGARGTTRRTETPAESDAGRSASEPATAAPEAEAEPSPRLIIVTKDGELIARDMKSVRRVTVERGQIVVTGTDGKVERHPMSNVVRMAIEP